MVFWGECSTTNWDKKLWLCVKAWNVAGEKKNKCTFTFPVLSFDDSPELSEFNYVFNFELM